MAYGPDDIHIWFERCVGANRDGWNTMFTITMSEHHDRASAFVLKDTNLAERVSQSLVWICI